MTDYSYRGRLERKLLEAKGCQEFDEVIRLQREILDVMIK